MLKWMWFLAVFIIMDIEGISMISIWHLGLAERIAMAVVIVFQVILFFLVCWFHIYKTYRTEK